MTGFEVEHQSLRGFHDTLNEGISSLSQGLESLAGAHVPPDAYSGLDAGQAAHRGHTQAVNDLHGLVTALHALTTSHADRTHQSLAGYVEAGNAESDDLRTYRI